MALRLVLLTLCCLLGAANAGRTLKQIGGGGIGGSIPISVDDQSVLDSAAFVVTAINADASLIPARSGDVSLVSITTASTQVVAGYIIRLTVVLEDSSNQYVVQAEVWHTVDSADPPMILQQPPQGNFSYVRREKSVRAPVATPAVVASPTVPDAAPNTSHGPCPGTSTKGTAKSKPVKAPKAKKPRKLHHRGTP